MKTKLFFLLLLLSGIALQAQTLVVDGVTYKVDTLRNQMVGPGTRYTALRLTTSKKRLDVFFLKTDLNNPHIQIRTALGRDSIYSTERPSALAKRLSDENNTYFAGTNGDFYNTSGYVGYPVAGNMVDGEIARIPGSNRSVFTIDDNKLPEIGHMTYQGLVKIGDKNEVIHSVNHKRGANELVLFNRHNGKYTRTNPHGTEALIELLGGATWATNKTLKARVLKKEAGVGNMAIPKGKAVLSGHGTAAQVLNQLSENDEIELRLNLSINGNSASNFLQMTGGDNYKLFLKDGVVEQESVWKQLHPRTALGHSQNRDTLIFCVVDGRGDSDGATTKQLAYLMKSAGAWTAFNMDGGGSSCMYIAGYGGPVNQTSDGHERAVGNSIYVVSTAPKDDAVSEIRPYDVKVRVPRYGMVKPKFMGYNQYGLLLNVDLPDVQLSCSSEFGYINTNGELVVTATESGILTATYGSATTQINVEVVGENSPITLKLNRLILDNKREYPLEVQTIVDGVPMKIYSQALNWKVNDPAICSVMNGVVRGLKNGKTFVVGSLDSYKDTLHVSVETSEAPQLLFDNFSSLDQWKLKYSGAQAVTLSNENLPAGWNTGAVVKYTYKGGFGPYLRLSKPIALYGLPDTLKITLNVQNAQIKEGTVVLKAANSSSALQKKITTFSSDGDTQIAIPLDKLVDIGNIAIYPISFQSIEFGLSGKANQIYSLGLKEISLCYKNYEVSHLSQEVMPDFALFPNPATDRLRIRFHSSTRRPQVIRLYALSGQLVKSWQLVDDGVGEEFDLDVNEVPQGTYYLALSGEKFPKHAVKIVKQ